MLIVFAVAVIFPGFLAGGLILAILWRHEEETTRALILESSRMDALAVDEQVGDIERDLQSLDRPEVIAAANSASFSSKASSVADHFKGSWIRLVDSAGREIAATRLTPATAPVQDEETEVARDAAIRAA